MILRPAPGLSSEIAGECFTLSCCVALPRFAVFPSNAVTYTLYTPFVIVSGESMLNVSRVSFLSNVVLEPMRVAVPRPVIAPPEVVILSLPNVVTVSIKIFTSTLAEFRSITFHCKLYVVADVPELSVTSPVSGVTGLVTTSTTG